MVALKDFVGRRRGRHDIQLAHLEHRHTLLAVGMIAEMFLKFDIVDKICYRKLGPRFFFENDLLSYDDAQQEKLNNVADKVGFYVNQSQICHV